jgi:ornithine cyclodeaminase
MRVLSRGEVALALPVARCIDAMRTAMTATSARDCVLPLRQFMPVPGRAGKLGLMPGYLGSDADVFGVKIVSKYERAPGDPHGTHVGAVMLFAADTGLPIALLEGGTLTAIRTAAATALATDVLARSDATRLAILGTGEEAAHHVPALLAVRPFEEVLVWGRRPERADALIARLRDASGDHAGPGLPPGLRLRRVDTVEAALREADVACTLTSAKAPFVRGEWLPAGLHLNLVGSAIATTAEVDDATVARGTFFVDYLDAARAQAGELLAAIRSGAVGDDHIAAELGQVLNGAHGGRRDALEITIYKSLGITTQDLAAARVALAEAMRLGLGRDVDL